MVEISAFFPLSPYPYSVIAQKNYQLLKGKKKQTKTVSFSLLDVVFISVVEHVRSYRKSMQSQNKAQCQPKYVCLKLIFVQKVCFFFKTSKGQNMLKTKQDN